MASPITGDSRNPLAEKLRLTLLGEFSVAHADGTPIHLPGKRERVLLAYLALQPSQRERRRKLTGILWGDASDETLLDNLRTCVWTLRKALGDSNRTLIVSRDDNIALSPGAIRVDALEIETLAKRSDTEGLEAAAKLYRGELLEGSEISSTEFETWLAARGTHLRDVAIDVYIRLADLHATAGKPERAIEILQNLLPLDPYHEGAIRRLMSLYVETGRRGSAFEAYRTLSEKLVADLGAEPELETRQLFMEISQGNYATSDTPNPKNLVASLQPNKVALDETASVAESGRFQATRRQGVLAVAFLVALVLSLGIFVNRSLSPQAEGEFTIPVDSFPLPERPSIAVLSFENLSDDSGQDSFADALTNDITTALSIISRMFVIDRGSTLVYADRSVPAQQIAEELGVRYLLEGSVQRSDGRVRVSTRLVDSLTGQQMWAERYDRNDQDAFALQDEITLAVITALQVQLTEGEQERISLVHGTQDLESWVIAGQALHLLRNFTIQDNARARELYQRAVELDPNYAGALDGLAWTYILAARFGWSDDPEGDFQIATELAARAMELDPLRSRSYALDGMLRLTTGEHDIAVRSGERAVELDPNGSEVAALLGLTLTYTGEAERSRELILQAMRLSPYYPDWYRYALGRALRMSGQYAEAVEVLTSFDGAGALRVMTLAELAETYVAWGREEDAREIGEEIMSAYPAFSSTSWTSNPPFSDASMAEAELALLRAAGLPD
jgi:adenylate cyclase